MGFLPQIREIASVSGGSITAGVLATAWRTLQFDSDGRAGNFAAAVAAPIMQFASVTVDVKAVLLSFLPGRSADDEVEKAYDRHLFHGANLQDLADRPRFTFMATNLQTGSGWRFAKDYAADYRVGRINKPRLSLARVVTASSAFPPFLSPVRLQFEPGTIEPMNGADLHKAPFTQMAVLTDGGVYDNLGLERIWKRCRTVLVSNAGQNTPDIGSPAGRWVGQVFRTLGLVQQQAENSRKRILFGMNNLGQRRVAYWSIDTPISAFGLADAVDVSPETTLAAASVPTRLSALKAENINLLLRTGYASADASLRARGLATNSPLADFGGLPQTIGHSLRTQS